MYLNQLAPWEEKKQYHEVIRLGSNLREQTEALKSASQAQIRAQLESANSIIASNERVTNIIEHGLNELSVGIRDISNGMNGLRSAFEWGISEVVWQIEQSNKFLLDILEVLMAPLDTKAKELKRRAEEAYSNGWYEDALEDFIKSKELNKYDFTIHISIGMIYLFHSSDKIKALESFEKAIKYSRPKSNYHTSYSLLYKSIILFDNGCVEEAEKASSEAIQLTPDFLEAVYQNAVYNAILKNEDKYLRNLRRLFIEHVTYVLKANSDKMFDSVREQINHLIIQIKDEKLLKFNKQLDDLKSKLSEIDEVVKRYNSICKNSNNIKKNNFYKTIKEIETLISLNSFFDTFACFIKMKEMKVMFNDYLDGIRKTIQETIQLEEAEMKQMVEEEKKRLKELYKRKAWAFDNIGIALVFLMPFIGLLLGAVGNIKIGNTFINVLIFGVIGIIINQLCRKKFDEYYHKDILVIYNDTVDIINLKARINSLKHLVIRLNRIKAINALL